MQDSAKAPPGVRRIVTQVASLETLVGAHPDALRDIYAAGSPADPAELGAAPRGRLLALEPTSSAYMLVRPVLRALAADWFPWKGKAFDHGGNSGQNVVLGRRVLRFRTELAPSDVDGKPTLALLYGDPAFKNPWPLRAIRDELRSIGPGIAMGPAFVELGGRRRLLVWWGLEA